MYDRTSASVRYRFLKTMMQLKQWEEGHAQRWLLKSPEHLHGLPELFETFPDARLVTIDRDVVPVYKSLLLLIHTTRSMNWPELDPEMTKFATDLNICSERQGLASVPSLGIEALSLHFDNVTTDAHGVVAQVATFAGLPWDEARKGRVAEAIAAARERKRQMGGKIHNKLFEEVGLSDAGIRERLSRCGRLRDYETWASAGGASG